MSERRQIVVVGTSVGGVRALKQLTARFPADFPAAILVVMHIGARESVLPRVLVPHSGLLVRHAVDGEIIQPGRILIAPPDHHLIVEDDRLRLGHGPKENFCRPAIDPLFRSAATAYRRKAIGVVLTGELDDGTIGLQAIKAYGGLAIVQDPAEAEASSMPASAVEHVDVDYCLPLDRIVDVLVEMVGEPIPPADDKPSAAWAEVENRFFTGTSPVPEDLAKIGKLSAFVCPECTGSLWEIESPGTLHFRCHTGHAYSARALASLQTQTTEEAIWAAVRALHDKETLHRRFAAMENTSAPARAEHMAAAAQASAHAEVLRKLITA